MYGESNSFVCSLKVLAVNPSTEEMISTSGKSWFAAYYLPCSAVKIDLYDKVCVYFTYKIVIMNV